MILNPTKSGGIVVKGDTAYGRFRVEWDATGQLVSESCEIPSRGLGDTIEKATSKIGIRSCGGCKRRRDWLNRAVPYKKK